MALSRNSSKKSEWKYHVFLSFRGEDTRFGFTDHLYAALLQKGIKTFRDNDELTRGEVISEELLCAIEESLCAIIIISQNYASSTWCLDELQKIVESKNSLGREAFPVFYRVDPSDVRHQKGSFAEVFEKHEENLVENKGRVQKWRKALQDVAGLSGWDSRNRYESDLIEEIVTEVWRKLEPKLPVFNDGLVAIDTKVDEMYSHLRPGSEDVCFIGIWGMGGIGKTTLANVILKKIRSQFDVSCFLANVREASKEGDQGLVLLQNKLLSHMKLKSMIIETSDQGRDSIRNCLHNKKVLLVLDDVSDKKQLENLAGNQKWFGPGSRIIVTTRDKHLLTSHRVLFELYEMKTLNTDESFQLFSDKAFEGHQLNEDYLELSRKVVEYSGGLPLALEVLGRFLSGRSIHEWKDALIKISKTQHDDIMSKLKISYDMLEEEYKTIFLDIACFFKGWYKDKVTKILGHCGFHSTIGVNVLIEKSLITCKDGILWMHDTVEEMGKTIAFQESPNDPGKRSRLWSQEDINEVLRTNTGSEKVQGVVLKQQTESFEEQWHPGAFSMMCNLKLLIMLCDLHLLRSLKCLPSSLKVLIWTEYPFKALPHGAQLHELVHLQMSNSRLVKLWNGNQFFGKLKVIDLSYSNYLIHTPNISGVPNLEELFLDGCVSLIEVHESIGQHKKLAVLSLIGCIKLKTLPRKLEMSSLKRLFLCGCLNIRKLPDFGENMECLSVLNLMNCSNLLCLPNTLSNLKSLKHFNLSGCSKVCVLPVNINENEALEDLDLSKTSIREVNASLFHLKNLKRLSFRGCSGPVSNSSEKPAPKYLVLPASVSGLSSLVTFDLSYCNLYGELIPEDLGNLSSLETLILSGNKDLVLPAASIANLSKLCFLELEGCRSFVDGSVLRHLVDFPVEAGLFLDLWEFWKLFESHDSELLCQVRDPSYPIIYLEIPPKFGNEIFFPVGSHLSKIESSASILVDIPKECSTGEWWGIVVFIAFEPSTLPSFKIELSWNFEASHPEAGRSLYLSSYAEAHYNSCLVTMIVNDSYIYIQLHHRRYHNIIESKDFSKHRNPEFSEISRLRFDVRGKQQKIKKCAYNVLSKEDFRPEALLKYHNRSVDEPNFENSSGLNNSDAEFGGEDANASNESYSSDSSVDAPELKRSLSSPL
ncbi:TMV resistance protein N-like [Abrus precatorius]|uniref:TMV resistance protein N-like n=1 Tax=Abrus precatorius TaxID=3816 RepID=A0A8B8M969_ABRPR|nr:TMV resistance protein N-like [Abrus precatorius]